MKNNGDKQLEQMGDILIKFLKGCMAGIKNMMGNLILLIIFLIVAAICLYVFLNREPLLLKWGFADEISIPGILIRLVLLVPIMALYIFGISVEPQDVSKAFESIKFCNSSGQYPELVATHKDGKKIIMSFKARGITLNTWRQRQADLEAALDCNIIKIEVDKKTKTIVNLHTVPASIEIGDNIPWKPEYMEAKDFVLVAGKGLLETITFDLNKYPHALIAGVTGGGKSVLLRLLLWECIKKGATPYMIDFKGGIELSAFEDFGEVVYERNNALELLKEINQELKLRLNLFRDIGVKNLTEYNQRYPESALTRVVIACDEVAEMLDKTGLSGADSQIFKEIEKEMATIARLGRAPGIHMILGTQRPDAKVIIGQIKNNLPIRISGRMTDVHASEMVLGNTKAASLGDTLGRFLYTVGSDTWEFQGFNFKDSDIIPGNYVKGTMLIKEEGGNDRSEDRGENSGEGGEPEFEQQKLQKIDDKVEIDRKFGF